MPQMAVLALVRFELGTVLILCHVGGGVCLKLRVKGKFIYTWQLLVLFIVHG